MKRWIDKMNGKSPFLAQRVVDAFDVAYVRTEHPRTVSVSTFGRFSLFLGCSRPIIMSIDETSRDSFDAALSIIKSRGIDPNPFIVGWKLLFNETKDLIPFDFNSLIELGSN